MDRKLFLFGGRANDFGHQVEQGLDGGAAASQMLGDVGLLAEAVVGLGKAALDMNAKIKEVHPHF